MRSLEDRFGDLLEELRLLPRDAKTFNRIVEIRRKLVQLDEELRTTVPAGDHHDELTKLSREARTKMIRAYGLAVTDRDAARAAAARKRHALEHPTTVLDAAPAVHTSFNAVPRRHRIERGYSR
ncbi:hypothetical protein ACIBJI_39910 [Nocardia sp. NPDC050408]|uniref:hypothetical protein n=1 Tax=Nocardia sp. NPDC050408 TaxID=3364319 RepID=UPI00379C8ABF